MLAVALLAALPLVLGLPATSRAAAPVTHTSTIHGSTIHGSAPLIPQSPASTVAATTAGVWSWPLDPVPRVVRAFERPPSSYAAGHRGIDLAAAPGQEVRAVDDGVVTHSGVIAGRGTVTVTHPSGIRSTYEPLDDRIESGVAVATGDIIGLLATEATFSHCAPASCLHLGARRGEDYLDPMWLLTRLRIVLLPTLRG